MTSEVANVAETRLVAAPHPQWQERVAHGPSAGPAGSVGPCTGV